MVSSISGYSAVNQLLLYRRDTSIGARKKIMMYIGLSKRLDALPIKRSTCIPLSEEWKVRLRYKGNRSRKSCHHAVGIVAEVQQG
jgi:hypothetical protein